jgi:YbgC/YbaW family acyl-CoA thioester hydrolase
MKSSASSDESGASFEREASVGTADLDGSGIVHFTTYARFLEEAENEFLAGLGFDSDGLRGLGVALARVHVEFDFYKPATAGEELKLRLHVAGVGAHSVRLRFVVTRGDEPVSLAAITSVSSCVDPAGRSVPMPEGLSQALRRHLSIPG